MDMSNRLYSEQVHTNAYKDLIEDIQAGGTTAPARPAAPPRPATPATPATKPKKNPFGIPKPAKAPQPKNISDDPPADDAYVAEGYIREAYEDEVSPKNREFWRTFSDYRGPNPIGKNPVIRQHGENLARQAYDVTRKNIETHGAVYPATNPDGSPHEQAGKLDREAVHRAFMTIQRLERRHKERLEQLAKEITVKIWGEEIRPLLEARLEPPSSETAPSDDDQPEIAEKVPANDQLIQKRVMANMLTQGSAMHLMFQAQHEIMQQLQAVDPQLPQLYSRFAYGSAHTYWIDDLERMAHLLSGMTVGRAKVDITQDENGEVEFTVKAEAVMFPILVQELCKGVAEYLSLAGLEGVSEAELTDLYKQVDNPQDEWYYIQAGHELWRKFLKVKPRDISTAQALVILHRLDVEKQNEVMKAVIENPEIAKELLKTVMQKPEEEVDDIIAAIDDESWRSSLDDDDAWRGDQDEGGVAELEDQDEEEGEDEDDWWKKI